MVDDVFYGAFSRIYVCLKTARWRWCKWSCPALLTSELVPVMLKCLQRCSRATVHLRPRVSFHSRHPAISHRDNYWCDRPTVSSRSPNTPQGTSSIIHCHNCFQNSPKEDPVTDFHLTPAGSLCPLQPGQGVHNHPQRPPSELSEYYLC